MPPSSNPPPRDRRLAAGLIVLALAGAVLIAVLVREEGAAGPARAVRVTQAPQPAGAPTFAAAGLDASRRSTEAWPEAVGLIAEVQSAGGVAAGDASRAGSLDESSGARRAVVLGTVVDVAGRPVGGAQVVLVPAAVSAPMHPGLAGVDSFDPDALPNAITGGEGRFEIEALHAPGHGGLDWPEVPAVVVLADGYVRLGAPCVGFTGDDYDLGVVAVEPGARLVGRVVDESGEPLAGVDVGGRMAGVQLAHLAPTNVGVAAHFLGSNTGEDGGFIADGFWPGRARVTVSAPGRAPFVIDDLVLSPGTTADLGEIALGVGGTLRGRVVDPDGRPVARAEVRILQGRPPPFSLPPGMDPLPLEWKVAGAFAGAARSRTDAAGRFAVAGLGHDPVSLWVGAPNFAIAARLQVPLDARDLTIELARPVVLVATVVESETGAPIAEPELGIGQTPSLWRVGDDPTGRPGVLDPAALPPDLPRAATDVVLGPLAAGGWIVDVGADGYEQRSIAVRIAPDAPVTRVEISLRPEAQIRGRLLADDGRPAVGVAVTALSPPLTTEEVLGCGMPGPWRAVQVRTDPVGRFSLEGLEAGIWTVLMAGDGYGPVPDQQVKVVSSRVTDLGMATLPREGVIEGVVRDAVSGAPSGGRSVILDDTPHNRFPPLCGRDRLLPFLGETHAPSTQMISDDSGRFRFGRLAPGRHELASERGAVAVVDVNPGVVARAELWLRRPPRLHGRVLATGAPVVGATVEVLQGVHSYTEPSWRAAGRTRTDAGGNWELDLHVSAAHRLVVSLPSGAQLSRTGSYDWDADVIEDFSFGGLVIEGRVLAAGEQVPVVAATVRLTGSGGLSAATATNAAGRFRFTHLQAGGHALSVNAPGYRDAMLAEVPLVAGLPAPDLEVRLTRLAGIQGRVTTADGRPAPDGLEVVLVRGPADCFSERCRQAQVTTSRGRYELFGVPAGDYQMLVLKAGTVGGRPPRDPILARRSVRLAPATHAHADLFLERDP